MPQMKKRRNNGKLFIGRDLPAFWFITHHLPLATANSVGSLVTRHSLFVARRSDGVGGKLSDEVTDRIRWMRGSFQEKQRQRQIQNIFMCLRKKENEMKKKEMTSIRSDLILQQIVRPTQNVTTTVNSITTTIATNLRFHFLATTLSVVFLLKTHSLCQILLPVSGRVVMNFDIRTLPIKLKLAKVLACNYSTHRKPSDSMRLIVTTFIGIVFGFFIGVSFPALTTKLNLPSNLLPAIDISYIQEKYAGGSAPSSVKNNKSISSQHQLINDTLKIWVPSNPRGAERLPPEIIEAETDFYLRRLWGQPSEDLTSKPKYLVTFTVGYNQRYNIDANVKKFSENFTIVLFHYDGQTTEWDEFEWSKRAIHVSVRKQTKWWYAKRFLHPDIVAPYDYIFVWDEDLGVEHFNAEEYLKLVKKHGLEISQPGLEPNKGLTWQMTKRRGDREVHKETEEKPGWCSDPHLPPCAAFVEIMAPVFSRDAWRCVWHMIQNDLVHGWGLDFALRKCVEPAHEKIGVVDSQWIIHQSVPSLGNQGESESGKAPWQGVRERCRKEWTMFQSRLANAEDAYYKAVGVDMFNSTTP
ncbi:unnamed protein product [Sphenostylis stenocarpa]|uniref:Uncharacterized protein n=1 Tax=Sphenostylis stenocarpa TaxID=92480 RepID=A0AA86VEU9_9FABA|nr:unnamed protein product [Sphenostylis stenocarpa]